MSAGQCLIAYYSFDDGTATDNSGSGNDGTVTGAITGIMSETFYDTRFGKDNEIASFSYSYLSGGILKNTTVYYYRTS